MMIADNEKTQHPTQISPTSDFGFKRAFAVDGSQENAKSAKAFSDEKGHELRKQGSQQQHED